MGKLATCESKCVIGDPVERPVEGRFTMDWISSIANLFLLLYLLDSGVAVGTESWLVKARLEGLGTFCFEATAAAFKCCRLIQEPS